MHSKVDRQAECDILDHTNHMPQTADKTGFKPKAIVKKLLPSLPERSRPALEARFGLGANPERVTLESIGKRWGITRERVRQIENHALVVLKKTSPVPRERDFLSGGHAHG